MQTVNELDTLLDEYEKNLGLKVNKPVDYERWLNLSYEEIKTLSPDDCAAGAYLLERYSLYLQKQCNRETTRVHWAEANLKRIVAEVYDNYSQYVKYDEREKLVIRDNDIAQKINAVRDLAKARLDRIIFLSGKINLITSALNEVRKTKTYVNRNFPQGD